MVSIMLDNSMDNASMDLQTSEIHVLESKVHILELKISELEDGLHQAKSKSEKQLFQLENIKNNDELVKLYAGIPDYVTLMMFYEEILRGGHGRELKGGCGSN